MPTPEAQPAINHSLNRYIPPILGFTMLVMDVAALILAYLGAGVLSEMLRALPALDFLDMKPVRLGERSYYYALLCILFIVAMMNKGHYSRRVPWWGQVQFILKCTLVLIIFDGFSYFSLQLPFSRLTILSTWVMAAAMLILARRLSLFVVGRSPKWKLPVVLLGDAAMVSDCMNAFYADGLTGYEVKIILLRDKDPERLDLSYIPKEHPPIRVVNAQEGVEEFIAQNPGYFYVFSLDGFRGAQRDQLMHVLQTNGIQHAIIPPVRRLHLYGMEPHYFFGNDVMLLHTRDKLSAPLGRVIKRSLDIFATSFVMPLLALMAVAAWVMKKVEKSPSPVFYGGMRVGKNGRLFPCWKFCTMLPGADQMLNSYLAENPEAKAEWDKFQKLKNDPRIDSSMSKWLRKTSLDELPQLFNVFIGDMSLVGPRPILPEQRGDYGPAIEEYQTTRPGLTGLWQVSGRNATTFKQRVYWDSWYIRNWSLWHDVVILIKTVRVFLTGSGAY